MIRSASDLLIGRKRDPQFTVRHFRMLHKKCRHRHNLCNARLIVRPKQCRTVRHDQVFSDILRKLRKFLL